MKKILVPTDFSVEADVALRVARDLAKATQAEIHFLHVVEPSGGGGYNMTGTPAEDSGMDAVFMVKLMERNKQQINRRANSSDFMGITTHTEIKIGSIYPTIKDFVDHHGIDLIVMGSKGTSGLNEVLVGSNAERLVRLATCPVLVVKEKSPEFQLKNIVLATNGEESSSKLAGTVRALQQAFDSHVHLVNVNTPNNFYRSRTMTEMLQGYAAKHGFTNYSINIYNDSSEEDGIIDFADNVNADLICMGTHGRRGMARFLAGSLAEEVVNHSARPVLTCRFDA